MYVLMYYFNILIINHSNVLLINYKYFEIVEDINSEVLTTWTAALDVDDDILGLEPTGYMLVLFWRAQTTVYGRLITTEPPWLCSGHAVSIPYTKELFFSERYIKNNFDRYNGLSGWSVIENMGSLRTPVYHHNSKWF